MPNVAIVIVNYNTRGLLAQCLRSVYAAKPSVPFHVIVVDNRSQDRSAEMVEADFPWATLITSDRNGGFGYANNLALRWLASLDDLPAEAARLVAAHGPAEGEQREAETPRTGSSPFRFPCDYVLFLNPDTVLPSDAVAETVGFLESHPQAGVV